jgi:hypothetical protein
MELPRQNPSDCKAPRNNTTSRIRSALHKAFPAAKFTVQHNGQYINRTDDGPTVEQVQEVLLKAKCITEDEREYFGGGRHFYPADEAYGNHVWFTRYNVAKHEAEKAESARWREEYDAKCKRQAEAVSRASQELYQRASRTARAFSPAPQLSPDQLVPLNAALERMREQAETEVKARFNIQDGDRRPSWAPPLIIEAELLDVCRELGYLAPEDPPICRLWAGFADPKRAGKWLRQHESRHTLEGIECRTFQLFAGPHRHGASCVIRGGSDPPRGRGAHRLGSGDFAPSRHGFSANIAALEQPEQVE